MYYFGWFSTLKPKQIFWQLLYILQWYFKNENCFCLNMLNICTRINSESITHPVDSLRFIFYLWFYPFICGNFIYLIMDTPEGAVLFVIQDYFHENVNWLEQLYKENFSHLRI